MQSCGRQTVRQEPRLSRSMRRETAKGSEGLSQILFIQIYIDYAPDRIASAIFSAVIMVGMLVLAQGMDGMIEASTTRRP